METFDIVVIGAGPGGYPAAIRAAQLGAQTAIIEKQCLGGTCLNCGCIPTKTLIASSELVRRMKNAQKWGIKVPEVSFEYPSMIQRKNEVVGRLRGGIERLLAANHVKVIHGAARFEARNRIAVEHGGATQWIGARKTIIATGSVSAIPGFLPQCPRIIDSRAFLDLEELPQSLLVMGGGIIGTELACMAAQLGSRVAVVEMLDDILPMADVDVCREVRRVMESDLGIEVLTGHAITDVTVGEHVRAVVNGKKLQADLLLVATGRRPVTTGFGLEQAGVVINSNGFVKVDEYGQTNIAGIFAVGDVTGGPQLAHAATSQGIVAAENAFTGHLRRIETVVPACIFTDPEVGSVGLTEAQTKAQDRNVNVGKFAFTGLGKAMAAGDTTGFVKLIADAETDRLIGAHAVGPYATELIAEAAVAIRAELTAAELGASVHCHPTYSEAWVEAAHAVHGTCIHVAPKRKIEYSATAR